MSTVALPNHVAMYRSRLDGMLAERQALDRRLTAAAQTGSPGIEIADQIRALADDIERTRLILAAAERAQAEEEARAAEKARERDRRALDRRHAATVEAALAFEALMTGPAVEVWTRYLDAKEAELADHRRLGLTPPTSGFSRPARVWANVVSRWLREAGQSAVEALRESATPKTLSELYPEQDTRPGVSPAVK